jgi:hypothetical protein
MESKSSLLCTQKPATGPYAERSITARPILILSSQVHLGTQCGLFRSKIVYEFLSFPMRATFLANFILLDFITLVKGEDKLWSYSLCKGD